MINGTLYSITHSDPIVKGGAEAGIVFLLFRMKKREIRTKFYISRPVHLDRNRCLRVQ